MFDEMDGNGAGGNTGHSVDPSKSSGSSPPATKRSLPQYKVKSVKVKLALTNPALDLLMKLPRFQGDSREYVRKTFIAAVQDRVREEVADGTKRGSVFWLSLTEIPGVTLVNIFDFQKRRKGDPLRNSVCFMAPWEALEDAREVGFLPALEALLMRSNRTPGVA